MTFKKQLNIIKENWLIVLALFLLILFLPSFSSMNLGMISNMQSYAKEMGYGIDDGMARMTSSYYPSVSEDFAPEVEDRVITKTASLSTEVKFGTFETNQQKLKSIIKSSDSYLLNENVNKYDSGWKEYYQGSYQIKIEAFKYDSVILQLKEIGEVQSFNENAQDITGRYTNLKTELTAEKTRLVRYQEMYAEATKVEDKITLSDRIYNQERTIKYLEDAISNIDKKVEYSTVYFTMNEKQSEYTNIVLVKFSALVKSLVNSFNNLLTLIFWAIPYAIAILLVYGIRKLYLKRR